MNKSLYVSVFVCLSLFATIASANTINVPNDQPTIQDAVNAASDGDVIQVLPGTYTEKINVYKSVTINGKGGKLRTFVQAPSSTDYAFWVTGQSAVIRGLTIQGGYQAAGILINAPSVKVIGCIVQRSGYGIVIGDGASHARISNNEIRYSTDYAGLFFPDLVLGTGVTVVSDFGGAITDVNISNNQIHHNDEAGIWIFGYRTSPSYDGLTMNSNVLASNGAENHLETGNSNRVGFLIQNVSSSTTITMNNNQVWATSLTDGELAVVGPNTPKFQGTGNQIFPDFVVTMQGQGKKLSLP